MKIACQRTYATLCIHSDSESRLAEVMKRVAGLTASRTVENKLESIGGFRVPRYGWFLSSDGQVSSVDVVDHIRWILQRLGRPEIISKLAIDGITSKLSCFWSSDGGGGGPVIPKELLSELARFGLDLEFDVYLGSDEPRH